MDLFDHRLATTPRGVHLFMLAAEVRMDPDDHFWLSPSMNRNGRTARDEMRELAEDLQRLESGWLPSEDELAGAPRMEEWGITVCKGEKLWRAVGVAHDTARDLPEAQDGETLCTMQILAVDDDLTWARDRRGFYRLGEPYSDETVSA